MVNNNVVCGAIIVERAGYGKVIINLRWPNAKVIMNYHNTRMEANYKLSVT